MARTERSVEGSASRDISAMLNEPRMGPFLPSPEVQEAIGRMRALQGEMRDLNSEIARMNREIAAEQSPRREKSVLEAGLGLLLLGGLLRV